MGKKILVVDDEPEIRSLVRTRLESNGFEVEEAADGEEGLDKLRAVKPDLVIVDVSMPKMDGYTFALEVKKFDDFKNLPIIILTAKDMMQDIFKIEGIKDYLVKPFEADVMLEKIQQYI